MVTDKIEALAEALYLAVIAPTEEQMLKAVNLAAKLWDGMPEIDVQKAKLMCQEKVGVGPACPRCGDPIEGYPALSRVDNATDICSPCGTREALWDWQHRGEQMPPVNQPIPS